MRRTIAFVLMITLLLLSGCGAKAGETAVKNFQQSLASAQSVSFTAKMRAEYPDKTENYTLDFSRSGTTSTVEGREPKLIAGIKAHMEDGSSSLEYDGAALDTGVLEGGLTPVGALPALESAMAGGHLDLVWKEGELTAAQITPTDQLTVTVWFDGGMNPCRAELQSSGKVVVYCDIINFTYK